MSLTHWLVVIVIALLLFGRGKISDLMGDLAKGIKSFKKGMAEDEDDKPVVAPAPAEVTPPARLIEHEPAPSVAPIPAAEVEPKKKAPARKPAAAKKAPAKSKAKV